MSELRTFCLVIYLLLGFPAGSMVKNLCSSAEDKGSIPDQGRSHMSWTNWVPPTPQLLSLCSRVQEPQLLKSMSLEPVLHNKRSHNERSAYHS